MRRAVTLARHNLFLLAAHGTLKTLPKKGDRKNGEKAPTALGRRELLRDAAARI